MRDPIHPLAEIDRQALLGAKLAMAACVLLVMGCGAGQKSYQQEAEALMATNLPVGARGQEMVTHRKDGTTYVCGRYAYRTIDGQGRGGGRFLYVAEGTVGGAAPKSMTVADDHVPGMAHATIAAACAVAD